MIVDLFAGGYNLGSLAVDRARVVITTGVADSDEILPDLRLAPFTMTTTAKMTKCLVECTESDTRGTLFEVVVYDAQFNKVATSEARETPLAGDFYIAMPDTTVLSPGDYYLGLVSTTVNAKYAIDSTKPAKSSPKALPSPATISPTDTTGVVVLTLYQEQAIDLAGDFALTVDSPYRCYGIDPDTNQPYGWNTLAGRLCRSVDSGLTWIDLMLLPPPISGGQETLVDLIVLSGKIYVFTLECGLHVSSDLTASATWTDISCPIGPTGRQANAAGRPYGFAHFNGNIFVGEYSNAPDELQDAPRILKYNIAGDSWVISSEFPGARHIHSFYEAGSAVMYVSLGDAGFGDQIGVHRLTAGNVGAPGQPDVYTQWTSPSYSAAHSDHYPVDFIAIPTANSSDGEASQPGLFMTSDRPGYAVLYCKLSGSPGRFNISPQIFSDANASPGETARSLVIDEVTNNIYWWTAETTNPALYMSPPPYTQQVQLHTYSGSQILTRSVYTNGYILMFNQRFSIENVLAPMATMAAVNLYTTGGTLTGWNEARSKSALTVYNDGVQAVMDGSDPCGPALELGGLTVGADYRVKFRFEHDSGAGYSVVRFDDAVQIYEGQFEDVSNPDIEMIDAVVTATAGTMYLGALRIGHSAGAYVRISEIEIEAA